MAPHSSTLAWKIPWTEESSGLHVRLFATPWTVATRLLHPWESPGKNTAVGYHFLLQGIFPTQRSEEHTSELQSHSG